MDQSKVPTTKVSTASSRCQLPTAKVPTASSRCKLPTTKVSTASSRCKVPKTSICCQSTNDFQPLPTTNDWDAFDFYFDPHYDIEIHSGNLPHWQQKNVWYFVTFRLADSLPEDIVETIKEEREIWLKKHDIKTLTNEEKIEYFKLFSKRTEDILDAGYGSCILKEARIAKIVENSLLFFNNQRYLLDEFIIMPNHVHLLVKPLDGNNLKDIVHSWKSFTANKINKALGKKGQLWMKESYDHIVRNEKALIAIRNYIQNNGQSLF